jgi:nitrogen fixation NifU-like protein
MSSANDIGALYAALLRQDAAMAPPGLLDAPSCGADGDNPACGDHIRVEARVTAGRILEIGYAGDCCAVARASAGLMRRSLQGATLGQSRALAEALRACLRGEAGALPGPLHLLAPLQNLPARHKCALLPWATLEAALRGEDAASSEAGPP